MKNIEELKLLAEAATPGPWAHGVTWIEHLGGIVMLGNTARSKQDVAYVAAANPAAILELIQQRDELLAALRGLYNVICYHDLTPDLLRKVNSIITKAGD